MILFSIIILITTIIFSSMYTDWKSAWNIFLNWFLSPVSALTGVICVVLCARGSWWNWTFGIVNSIAYGIIAWQTGYYGDAILNIFYFLPTQFFIMKLWEKNRITEKTDIIVMKRMSLKQIIILSSIGIIITIAFGFILSGVDHYAINVMKRNVSIYENINKVFHFPILGPMLDSSTEFFQIGAEVLLILRFAEQWVLWIATNVLTIIMWLAVIFTDKSALPYAVPTLVMWIAYLVNSVYGLYVWRKNSKGGN